MFQLLFGCDKTLKPRQLREEFVWAYGPRQTRVQHDRETGQ